MSEVVEIKSTRDYDKFKVLLGNRELSNSYLDKLECSILENNLLSVQPVLVNENWEIIDGQNRFHVAKRNNLDIYYLQKKGLRIKDVHTLNTVSKTWTLQDYLNMYIKKNKHEYIQFSEYLKKFPMITITGAISLFINKSTRGKNTRSDVFKYGNLDLKNIDQAVFCANTAKYIFDLLPGQKNKKKFVFGYQFLESLLTLSNQNSFDQSVLRHKIELQQSKVVNQRNQYDYTAMLLEIYNFNNRRPLNVKGHKNY